MYCNIFVKINTDLFLSAVSLTYLPKLTLLSMIDNKKVFFLIKLLFYLKMIKKNVTKLDWVYLGVLHCSVGKRNNVSECMAWSQLLINHLNLSISLWNLEPLRYRSTIFFVSKHQNTSILKCESSCWNLISHVLSALQMLRHWLPNNKLFLCNIQMHYTNQCKKNYLIFIIIINMYYLIPAPSYCFLRAIQLRLSPFPLTPREPSWSLVLLITQCRCGTSTRASK